MEKIQTEKPFEAEAFVAKLSLKVTEERGEKRMIFEGDALNVVRSLRVRGHSMSEELSSRYMIVEGKEILAKHPNWKVDFVPRDCNKEAHNIRPVV